ncbi:putative reverse transcriptase domain-containing protein [Tanacetum coccineum]|uniref:Reverse transcriptase domain-containing protein n=1 Tax=Tanacetum coccineum TaxID=301880 RepID=A0ABQ5FQ68_9ASTR
MPPRMMTQSASRATAAPRGGRTGGRTGRGGGRTSGRSSDLGNGRIDGQGGQVGGKGTEVNDGVDGVPDFATIIVQQLQNLPPIILPQVGDQGSNQGDDRNQNGCTYKEFLACNPKEYDGKGGAIVYTYLIKKMESVQDMSGCRDNQKVKYTAGSFIADTLTDEAIRNGSIKKNPKKRGNRGEPSKDRSRRDDNKRSRTGNDFTTTKNPVRRETTGVNRPNQALAIDGGQGRGNNGNQACGKAFMLGAEEACQDPNIVTSMFTLNNHYATTLFDSSADYSFVSTTFIPLLGIEPSDLGFSYEIEIASGQLVEIDKVIKGCKLEIDGHVFVINLILFRSRSFVMIIGMDWLSNHKAEIICHEKVVRIPLDGKVLRVLGERPEEKARHLMIAKAKEHKQEEMVMSNTGHEISLSIDTFLNGGVVGSTQRTPGQGFHLTKLIALESTDPSKIEAVKNWEAPRTPSEVRLFLGLAGKTFDWGEEHERTFQTLKDKLCKAHVLALPDRPGDFMVYCEASGLRLGCVLMQRGKIELFSDYDCKIRYHPGKANVVADTLGRKERIKPKRIRVMNMTLQLSIKSKILAAQKKASNEFAGLQRGLDEMIKHRSNGALYYLDQIWVPLKGDVRTLIIDKNPYVEAEVGEGQLIGPELVQETTEKISQIKDILMATCVVRFGKKGKLAPRFVGPFEITKRIGSVAYRLRLSEELNGVHGTLHVSNLKKCLADPTLQVPLDEIQVDDKLNFIEEPLEILERKLKKLKRSRIAIVKVWWNSKCGPEFTWEREDQMRLK